MLTSKSESYCDRLADLQLNSMVLYGTNSSSLLRTGQGEYSCYTADEYQSGALHHVTLGLGPEGPLRANTQYFYQVGDPQLALSELYSFTTPPEAGVFPYRLGLIGDLGQTENSMDTLDHAAALEPVSVLNVGDLSYADGYQPRYEPMKHQAKGCCDCRHTHSGMCILHHSKADSSHKLDFRQSALIRKCTVWRVHCKRILALCFAGGIPMDAWYSHQPPESHGKS